MPTSVPPSTRTSSDEPPASGVVAWLRMEPAGDMAYVRLSLGGEDRLLARAGYHGDPLDWLG